jgi:hypothetical protein
MQNPSSGPSLLVRTSMDEPLKIAGSIQAAISRVERKVPLYGTTTLEDRLREFLTPRRFQTSLVV